jgi:hypothetical protein
VHGASYRVIEIMIGHIFIIPESSLHDPVSENAITLIPVDYTVIL